MKFMNSYNAESSNKLRVTRTVFRPGVPAIMADKLEETLD